MSAASKRIPVEAARLARDLRVQRRTRSGLRWRPWPEIADEVARQGHGQYDPVVLAEAAGALPAEEHPAAGLNKNEQARIEASWRDGFAREFPDEPWPGLRIAQERIRSKWARS